MIIILEAEKDTYVTNLKTSDNDGSKSNLGQAATLDLFKLFNENKNSKSWASFKFTGLIPDGEFFTIQDSLGVSKTFEFDADGNITADRISIDISGETDFSNYASIIESSVNSVSDLDITAYSNSNNELILKQNKSGDSGDTEFVLPVSSNMSHSGNLTKFSRIDFSTVLIKFDLKEFKSDWGIGTSLSGAFNNLKASLILKDVSTGIAKPKDYKLQAYKLLKKFDEGLGKDTVHFSDEDVSNFYNLNNDSTNNLWDVAEFITHNASGDISNLDNDSNFTTPEIEIKEGDEDLILDITEYIKDQIILESPDDVGILIKLSDEFLFNNKTYFAKRFGSRHLLNKKLVPQLQIKINDSSYAIPKNSYNKSRFLGKNEKFYLYNNNSGSYLSDFNKPTETCSLKFRIKNLDNTTVLIDNNSVSDVINFRGNSLLGIKETTINIDRYDTSVSSLIKNNKLETNIFWYWLDSSDSSEYEIYTQKITFSTIEKPAEIDFRNLISIISIDENTIVANDSTSSLKVYFNDTKKEYNAVKTPYELPSENLGSVKYSIVDVETNKVLVDYDDNATLMFFDGEKYTFDLYVPNLFKNTRVNFKFKYKDIITNTDKIIYNEKYSIRIV